MYKFLISLFVLNILNNQTLQSQSPIVWNSSCDPHTFCLNQNACIEGKVDLSVEALTTCSGGTLNYLYRVDVANNGTIDITGFTEHYVDSLPKGTHLIIWRAADLCGNAVTCSYTIKVEDCQPPNLLCRNGLTQNMSQPTCEANFTANTFILNLSDNCTQNADIERGIRVTGSGTGFPTTNSVTFDKCNLGFNFVDIWVRDAKGNVNNCQSYVSVQNNAQDGCICNQDADIRLKGCVTRPNGKRINNYKVRSQVQATSGVGSPINTTILRTSLDSCYDDTLKLLPFGGTYNVNVRPIKTDLAVNGVTSFDLLLISKHILGIQPFTNIYQYMAADVNNSGTVTTIDIVEIRKVILGINDSFALVPAWRFVKPVANTTLVPGPSTFDQQYSLLFNNLQNDTTINNLNFIAIKSGDIDHSASFSGGNEEELYKMPTNTTSSIYRTKKELVFKSKSPKRKRLFASFLR
jgi:hypothetical protein